MDDVVELFAEWARARDDVVAAALVGSHARGDARPDSDVDLMIVTDEPAAYVSDHGWLSTFGEVERVQVEEWGAVTSLRVFYRNGAEVELGLAPRSWAKTNLVDPGTSRVVRDGMRILYDPEDLLRGLAVCLQEPPRRQ